MSQNCEIYNLRIVTVTYLLFFVLWWKQASIYKFTITTFFLLRDGWWLPLKALSTLRIIYQVWSYIWVCVCVWEREREFAYVWMCCIYPGCTVGTSDADSLWSTTVLFRRENFSCCTYTYTSLLGNTANSQCGSSYSLWHMYVSEGVIF